MSRPSKAIEALAKQIAKNWPKRQVAGLGGKIQMVDTSWKNRQILHAATAFEARQRIDAHPERYPNHGSRQQTRWLKRRGLLHPLPIG